MIERGIREVCNEAIHFLRHERDPDETIYPGEVIGYFDEIVSILNDLEDDWK